MLACRSGRAPDRLVPSPPRAMLGLSPRETDMAGREKQDTTPKDDGKPKKPPPPADDDDYEDGDIATPKKDRYGNDDEPLE
jgi:hypothetical protein